MLLEIKARSSCFSFLFALIADDSLISGPLSLKSYTTVADFTDKKTKFSFKESTTVQVIQKDPSGRYTRLLYIHAIYSILVWRNLTLAIVALFVHGIPAWFCSGSKIGSLPVIVTPRQELVP